MCGRYTLYDIKPGQLSQRFKTQALRGLSSNYNVAPGQFMPVIRRSEDGSNRLDLMRWGFIPHWAKDMKIGYRLINARDDSLFDKPMWRQAVRHNRCLVPARGFYEWKLLDDGRSKQPYFIYPKATEIFAFAGLWSSWKDADGRELLSFAIVTTGPNREMSEIHNRMPVILDPDEEALWLDPGLDGPDDIEKLLHPYHDNGLEMYPVSTDVNSPRVNDEHLVKPAWISA